MIQNREAAKTASLFIFACLISLFCHLHPLADQSDLRNIGVTHLDELGSSFLIKFSVPPAYIYLGILIRQKLDGIAGKSLIRDIDRTLNMIFPSTSV